MGIPYDNVERVQWRVDDGDVHECDFRIVNGIKYVPERTCTIDCDYCCSECESDMVGVLAYDSPFQRYPNYCPNCGAKVVG